MLDSMIKAEIYSDYMQVLCSWVFYHFCAIFCYGDQT